MTRPAVDSARDVPAVLVLIEEQLSGICDAVIALQVMADMGKLNGLDAAQCRGIGSTADYLRERVDDALEGCRGAMREGGAA